MDFIMPKYAPPDFSKPEFLSAPDAPYQEVEKDGVAPENFHSTSMYPEYVKLEGRWRLAEESRMDSCIVWNRDGSLSVVESRNLKRVIGSSWAAAKTEKMAFISTPTALGRAAELPVSILFFVRAAAGRHPMPEITTGSSACCAMKSNTAGRSYG